MGKPRMIIVIRHAQSEGNQNKQIHQTCPDHRVKLTPEGWTQAHEAGRRLRSMLQADDTVGIFTSPYRRTRETTEGMLRSLTSDDPEPSPFKRQAIKVWEEPRLREQDFGNYQPNSDVMERMWRDRSSYGHFFFRIPNGESAADAYDRVSGFNESLWRSFNEDDFPSVCVLVTHGLMTRVFLMKWYHWSVEYFENLRNMNHCEMVVMDRSAETGKYVLQNKLRTWTELKRQAAIDSAKSGSREARRGRAPSIPMRKRWGECPDDCDHVHDEFLKSSKRRNTGVVPDVEASSVVEEVDNKPETPAMGPQEGIGASTKNSKNDGSAGKACAISEDDEAFPKPESISAAAATAARIATITELPDTDDSNVSNLPLTADAFSQRLAALQRPRHIPNYLEAGRDFGGSFSGAATPTTPGSPSATHSRGPSGDYFASRLSTIISREEQSSAANHDTKDEQQVGSHELADALGDQIYEQTKTKCRSQN